MHYILTITLICFFVLMCFALIIIILQGISIVLLQISGRIYIAPFSSCESTVSYSTLYFKKRFVDTIYVYSKHKRKFYFLGTNGVYKSSFLRIQKVDVADLDFDEKSLLIKMRSDTYRRMVADKKILDSYIYHYEQANDDLASNP